MKASELVKLMTEVINTKGDVTVRVLHVDEEHNYSHRPVEGHFFLVNDDKRADSVVLLEKEELQAHLENAELEVDEIERKL